MFVCVSLASLFVGVFPFYVNIVSCCSYEVFVVFVFCFLSAYGVPCGSLCCLLVYVVV